MKKIIYFIQVIINYYITFGFSGIVLLLKRVLYREKTIAVKIPFYKEKIFLRNSTSDISVFNQVFLHKEYSHEYKISPKVIIDCGANIGLSAVYFKNRFPDAKIIAIEPEKNNFEMLLKNTNNYSNIICLNNGIWSKSCNLLIENLGYGNSEFITKEVSFVSDSTIKSISIEDLLFYHKIESIDILKIDIEGSEKEVFDSISKEILSKIKVIIVELHDRMKKRCSKSFFNAIKDFEYSLEFRGEYVICYLNNEF